jgi:chromosome segregation ATPase
MDEQTRLLEMLVGPLDKRLGAIEQHLAGFHAALQQVRDEVAQTRRELHAEIIAVRTELKNDIAELRTELKGEMAQLRTELKGEMAQLRTELKGDMARLENDLRAEMRQLRGEMDNLRAEGRSHLRWSLGGMFVLFGAAGPLWMWVISRILK